MNDAPLATSDNQQQGVATSVTQIRKYRDIWERHGTQLGFADTSLKTLSLIASASVAAFGQDIAPVFVKILALLAFTGTALTSAHRLAKKSDIYWRAWRIVNCKIILYEAGEISFSELAKAHREAESLFEGWQEGDKPPATPRSSRLAG